MLSTPLVRIDLLALQANLGVVRRLCPGSRIMAMVKADAYGHGLLPVAEALSDADGLAVARLPEALHLRASGIKSRILLLATPLDAADLGVCSEQNIDVTAHDHASVALIVAQAKRSPVRVWLKLDSGLHRVGLTPDAFIEADRMLSGQPGVTELIHMTQFSSAANPASPVTERQISLFWQCHNANSAAQVSLANSAALITRRDVHADWVRPGIMLYGYNPLGQDHPLHLRAAMTLSAPVIAVREIGADEPVGYDGCWTSERVSRVATVGIGYGDGYPRHACNGTPVWINGHTAPMIGRVSMDSLTVDVTDCGPVLAGDEVILWGPQLPVARVAECAGTIPGALFSSLLPRVVREYMKGTESLSSVREQFS